MRFSLSDEATKSIRCEEDRQGRPNVVLPGPKGAPFPIQQRTIWIFEFRRGVNAEPNRSRTEDRRPHRTGRCHENGDQGPPKDGGRHV